MLSCPKSIKSIFFIRSIITQINDVSRINRYSIGFFVNGINHLTLVCTLKRVKLRNWDNFRYCIEQGSKKLQTRDKKVKRKSIGNLLFKSGVCKPASGRFLFIEGGLYTTHSLLFHYLSPSHRLAPHNR